MPAARAPDRRLEGCGESGLPRDGRLVDQRWISNDRNGCRLCDRNGRGGGAAAVREVQQGVHGCCLAVRAVSLKTVLFTFRVVQGMGVVTARVVGERVELAGGRQHRLQRHPEREQAQRQEAQPLQATMGTTGNHGAQGTVRGPRYTIALIARPGSSNHAGSWPVVAGAGNE